MIEKDGSTTNEMDERIGTQKVSMEGKIIGKKNFHFNYGEGLGLLLQKKGSILQGNNLMIASEMIPYNVHLTFLLLLLQI